MNINSLGRKIAQVRHIGVDDAFAYFANYLNKVENSFRQRKIHQLRCDSGSAEQTLAAALGVPSESVHEMTPAYEAVAATLVDFCQRPATADDTLTRVQYQTVRLVRPDRVLETGVWWGVSSAVMLAALRDNKRGQLFSVDMPPMDPQRRVEIGAAVPAELRGRWTLKLGSSRKVLPEVCAAMGSIDVFVHDSDHTYRCMRMEFGTVWPYLRPGGLLIADDVHTNDAFLEFAEEVSRRPFVLSRRKGGCIGLIQK